MKKTVALMSCAVMVLSLAGGVLTAQTAAAQGAADSSAPATKHKSHAKHKSHHKKSSSSSSASK